MSNIIFRVQPAGRNTVQEMTLQKGEMVILTGCSQHIQVPRLRVPVATGIMFAAALKHKPTLDSLGSEQSGCCQQGAHLI